jgi:phosphoglycerate dehydrogenase-like enzyme
VAVGFKRNIIQFMKVVIPEDISIIPSHYYDEISKICELTLYKDFPENDEEIVRRSKNAELLIVKWINFPDEIITESGNLKYVITATAGYSHLPLEKASKKQIQIINCPTHNSQAVAEHVFALMFALSRKVVECQINMIKGNWKKSPYSFLGDEVSGKTLGIIGYGNVGKKVNKIGLGLGMKIIKVDSGNSMEDFEDLIKNSDYISLNVSLNDKTRLMINEQRINLMKASAFLINTSRGAVIDQEALFNSLKAKRIAGAGLDVFQNEPSIGKVPKEIAKLANLPNVIVTPHVAFNTNEAGERLGMEIIQNIKAIIKGKPINVVN